MDRVAVFNLRQFDEAEWFARYGSELGLEISGCPDAPDMGNIEAVTQGCSCVNIITSRITRKQMEEFARCGVRYLATRTIGYDHIDLKAAAACGIHVGNAPYAPNGVADYTMMLILMSIRHMKRILERTNIQDYTLQGLQGRELKDLTVGVIGTGRIGQMVISSLSGFGCPILAYDPHEKEEVRKLAAYVSLEELWEKADVITLHAPLTEENYHLVNSRTLEKMKDGVVIVNTARGGLIDSDALIAGVENGKVGAAALDVVENEFGLYYYDHKSDALSNRQLAILRGFPNVTVSHHMAFYTDQYTRTVIRDSLAGCRLFLDGKQNPWEVC